MIIDAIEGVGLNKEHVTIKMSMSFGSMPVLLNNLSMHLVKTLIGKIIR